MRCTEAQMQLLLCRNDAELNERTALARHVRGCLDCRRAWHQAMDLNDLLGALPASDPDDGFTQRVMAEVWREPSLAPAPARPLPAAERRSLIPAFGWGSAAAAQVADWTLAMVTTFAVSALMIALLSNAEVARALQPLLQQAAAKGSNLAAWLPQMGDSLLNLSNRLLLLLNSIQLPAF